MVDHKDPKHNDPKHNDPKHNDPKHQPGSQGQTNRPNSPPQGQSHSAPKPGTAAHPEPNKSSVYNSPPSDNKANTNEAQKPADWSPPKASTIIDPNNPPDINTHQMVGDLKPGQLGYLPLDEVGHPTSTAVAEFPIGDAGPHAPVFSPAVVPASELVTPAGAPITNIMNPIPNNLMDEAFLSRNPLPPEVSDQDVTKTVKLPHTAGAPVINEPVTS